MIDEVKNTLVALEALGIPRRLKQLEGSSRARGVSGGSAASIGSTIAGGTVGSVLVVGAGVVLAQDNANLFWDRTGHSLGLGYITPIARVESQAKASTTATGTTTVNNSTTVTGVGTLFLTEVAIGSKIALSSAAGTTAHVVSIASNTSLTLDQALGNGTSQTITVSLPNAIFRNPSGTGQTYITDDGFIGISTTATGPNFGNATDRFAITTDGNIRAARYYGNTFRDTTSFNTYFSVTGTSPNQAMTFGNGGMATMTFTTAASTGTIALNGITTVTSPASGVVPFTVQGAASQSVNLQNWSNSTPTVLASVDKDGNFISNANGNGGGYYLKAPGGTVGSIMTNDTANNDLKVGNTSAWNGIYLGAITGLFVNGNQETGLGLRANSYGARFTVQQATSKVGIQVYAAATTPGDLLTLNTNGGAVQTGFSSAGLINKYNSVATKGYGVPALVEVLSLTAQTADITTTNLANSGTAGLYRVSYSLEDTTADLTAGTVTLTLAYTDGAGATTTTANQLLTGVGRQSGVIFVQLASGNITYATSHTGIFGTAVYSLYITAERLN